ncbi:50S ribosomal protein L24 [Candidatus Micrarchaeota archaeon]|nr:50S ribosomal protein L24 [Candidatus Micrarchaeota archaeon]
MKFSKNVTIQPRKRRKAMYNAKIHEVRSMLSIHLSKELRKKYKKRALLAKKGDKVRILRGEFKKREGKIVEVDYKDAKIFVEGIIYKKQGGKEKQFPIQPSNCVLLEWAEPKLQAKGKKEGIGTTAAKVAEKPKPQVEVKKPLVNEAKNPIAHEAKIVSSEKISQAASIKQ